MGYTHYWTPSFRKIVGELKNKITNLLEEAQSSGIISNLEITENTVIFDGECETFYYEINEPWSFCKTGKYAYDIYVCAVLILLWLYHDIPVSSDGALEDWQPAIQLLKDKNLIPDFGLSKLEDLAKINKSKRFFSTEH